MPLQVKTGGVSRLPLWLLALTLTAGTAFGGTAICSTDITPGIISGGCGGTSLQLHFDTQLTNLSMDVTNLEIPAGPGFNPVLVDLHLGLNPSQPSLGHVDAFGFVSGPGGTINPNGQDSFFVDSSFDVFYQITLTNIDPCASGGPGVGTGTCPAPPVLSDLFGGIGYNGQAVLNPPSSAHLETTYQRNADPSLANDGLVPPDVNHPYIGHQSVGIPLFNGSNPLIDASTVCTGPGGVPVFGALAPPETDCVNYPNGRQYEFGFKVAQHYVDPTTTTTTIDPVSNTVTDTFNTAGFLAAGMLYVGDVVDPPFTAGVCSVNCTPGDLGLPDGFTVPTGDPFSGPGSLSGPTTADTSPEPGSTVLVLFGLAAVGWRKMR